MFDARVEGVERARKGTPTPIRGLQGQFMPDVRSGGELWDDTQAQLLLGIGDRRGAELRRWASQAEALEAERRSAWWRLQEEVRDTWLEWWVSDALAHHLDEHIEGLVDELGPLRDAASKGAVAPAVVLDLEVELARLRSESAKIAMDASEARTELAFLLGKDVRPSHEALPDLEQVVPEEGNPWRELDGQVDGLPQLQSLDAQIDLAQRSSRALKARWTATLGLGVGFRANAQEGTYAVPMVTLMVPLGSFNLPDARMAQGEAEALRAQRDWQRTRWEAKIRAEARALDAARARHHLVADEVEGPLRDRVARVEAGLRTGSVSVAEVILARRDLHEAFHERAAMTADLLIRQWRGEALLHMLSGEDTP